MDGEKKIIGLIGEPASGKDTVADYLKEKYGAEVVRYSDPLREGLAIFLDDNKIGRADFTWLSTEIRGKYGNHILSEALVKRTKNSPAPIVVFNGLRIAEDLEFLKTIPGAFSVYVTVDQKTRWERIYGRGEKADDAVSFERFQELERASTEIQIPEIGRYADFKLINDKTKEDLFARVDEIMAGINK